MKKIAVIGIRVTRFFASRYSYLNLCIKKSVTKFVNWKKLILVKANTNVSSQKSTPRYFTCPKPNLASTPSSWPPCLLFPPASSYVTPLAFMSSIDCFLLLNNFSSIASSWSDSSFFSLFSMIKYPIAIAQQKKHRQHMIKHTH